MLAMRGGACARECVSELHCARWTRRWSTTAREIDTLGERGLDTIRGLRVCQNEECRLHMNRDKTSAPLIGIQCKRLLRGDKDCSPCNDQLPTNSDQLFFRERKPAKIHISNTYHRNLLQKNHRAVSVFHALLFKQRCGSRNIDLHSSSVSLMEILTMVDFRNYQATL